MANALYNPYKQSLPDSSAPDLSSVDVKVVLVDTDDYTFSAAHNDLADVAAGSRVATSGNLASKTITNGAFDADDITFSAVSGDQSEALIVYYDSTVEATSILIAYIDTVSSGLPVTPNGGDITVTWGANIFTF